MDNPEQQYEIYFKMRDRGVEPEQIAHYYHQSNEIYSAMEVMKILKTVYGMTLVDAKEIAITYTGSYKSLDEYQERLYPTVVKALSLLELEDAFDFTYEDIELNEQGVLSDRQREQLSPSIDSSTSDILIVEGTVDLSTPHQLTISGVTFTINQPQTEAFEVDTEGELVINYRIFYMIVDDMSAILSILPIFD